ncbi:c-type cytochrome [Novosphingobium sediminicola]|uniref:Mono/diheme cytochrome c family protein n=1 Tax=Novosphingobium sediminicola TaxID=563162 RepID=A0A7W6CIJ2_9SPHN|nr:cytochrome c [Novosphingobium sediminicola]MBB3955309.1 mono/diheme cytochrome c family protein [Novosphingobium sediminicola]
MKKILFPLVALSLGALGLSAPAHAQRGDATPTTLIAKPGEKTVGDADGAFTSLFKFNEPTGEAMYKRVCAGCHMPDAKGAKAAGMYPALAANKNLATAGYPLYIVLHGKNGMPPVGKMMTDQQVADVVNYVRTNFGNKYKDKVTAADAKATR